MRKFKGGIVINREIKFRVWDNTTKEMLQLQKMSFKTSKCMPYGGNIEYEFDNLMQYTGLKDIDNKEIYEGDILQGGYANKLTGGFESRLYVVEFEKGTFKGKLIGESPYGDTWLNFLNKKSYVIGNIYENPELLEV
ncbi:YopX family protein [Clostridium botulinum]|uniref:YopX family protein n=1 Tax=Clostridium botulinum TaxID=1491 RepID=UPI00311AB53D